MLEYAKKNRNKIDRTVVVVDLENLCGSSKHVARYHREARQVIEDLVGGGVVNYVIATGPAARGDTPDLPFAWPNARWLVGHGIDGADIALVEVLLDEPTAAQSTRVVVVGGDHRYATPLHWLGRRDVDTLVISRESALSRECRLAARNVITIPDFDQVVVVPQEAA